MIGQHCGKYMTVVRDTCLAVTKRCLVCGERFTQKKRRPKGATPLRCTWAKTCAAHPGKS